MPVRLLFAAALALSLPAAAGELGDAERKDLTRAVEAYKQAYTNREAPELAAALPPGVVAELAGGDGEAARRDVAALVQEQLARETTIDLEVRTDKVGFGTTPDGLEFAVVPFVRTTVRRDKDPIEVTRTVAGQPKKVKLVTEYESTAWSHVLAIREDGRWHLLSLTDADAVEALLRAYPAFRDIPLPRVRSQMQARSVQLE